MSVPSSSRDYSPSLPRHTPSREYGAGSPCGSGGASFSSSSIAALSSLLTTTPLTVLLGERKEAARRFRCGIAALVRDARLVDATRGERMIIDLRQVWNALPAARHLCAEDRDELWTRLIAVAIDEFYAPTAM